MSRDPRAFEAALDRVMKGVHYAGFRSYEHGESPQAGHRGKANVSVIGDGDPRELAPRLDLRNHSPTGFEWGYAGSGPAQLALAILADATSVDAIALQHYQRFKFEVVAQWGAHDNWMLSRGFVAEWLRQQRTQAH